MWFPTGQSELSFIETAPYHFNSVGVIPASAARVFDLLSTGETQKEWFQDFVACRWTSPKPYGVGSTREIELRILTVKERFLVWEPGKRLTFSIDAITVPLIKGMVEDMQLEPISDTSTLLRWRAYYDPSAIMRAVHPVGRAVFGQMFRASTDGLARFAARVPVAGK
jgi:Polyketide cyclase / dehydrase and lipid transport